MLHPSPSDDSDSRKNNLKEIEQYFVDIVRIFSKLGYSHVGKIYIEGTKLKGNASAKRTKDRAGFEKWLSEIEEALKIMKEEEREKINLHRQRCQPHEDRGE